MGRPIYSMSEGLRWWYIWLQTLTDASPTLQKLPWYFVKQEDFTKKSRKLKTGCNQRANLASHCVEFPVTELLKGFCTGVPTQPPFKASDSFTVAKTERSRGMKSRHSKWISAVRRCPHIKTTSCSINDAGLQGSCLAIQTTEGMWQRDQGPAPIKMLPTPASDWATQEASTKSVTRWALGATVWNNARANYI